MEQKEKATTGKPSYKDIAYERIKDAILFNRFRIGAIYSQESICRELGISKTPLREALLELQTDGYVSFCRGRGVLIQPVSYEKAHDILEARITMEPICAQLAAQRADEEDRQKMKNLLTSLQEGLPSEDGQRLYRIDHSFHRMVIKASHNEMFYRFLDVILDHYLRFEVKSVYNNSIDARKVYMEHRKVYEAIAAGDEKKAYKAMETHLKNSFARTLPDYWK
ncbi:GntR family transcriptional regulator [Acidaminococcus timonensis]|uniref:GntR family transcriptional regulator n=1 Tax=Acidaminococcus timonensis TaxID=1871002 RepID=UPI00248CF8BA|nr:GntR family transcriptional regulator [Acidaminococcus timonensis]